MPLMDVHRDVVERFRRLSACGRMGHAYLFTGPHGAGKMQTALAVAQLVNCEDVPGAPCGVCVSCRKIASGNHPDIHILALLEEENTIKIEQTQQMIQRTAFKAYEAEVKVFIIRGADLLTRDAANSLLKTLEEPAPNTLMLLTTAVPEACLDTIKSRCHVIPFFPHPLNRVAQALWEEGVAQDTAAFLAFYTDGCLGRARQLAKEDMGLRKNQWINEFFLSGNNEDFLKGLASDRPSALEALTALLAFVRDAVLLKSGAAPADCAHQDRLRDIKLLAQRPLQELSAMAGQIVRARKLINENLNAKMALSLLKERTHSLWDI